MNAKLFVSEKSIEIRLETGEQFFPKKKETKEAFIARIKAEVEEKKLEAIDDIKEINAASLNKFNAEQLGKALETAKDTHAEVIQEALDLLEANYKVAEGKGFSKNGSVAKAKRNALESKEGAAKEPKEKKEKVAKEPKEKKPALQKAGLAEIEAMKASQVYADAQANVGKTAEFSPNSSIEKLKGVIKSLSLNKTATKIYYTVLVGDKRVCCSTENATLKLTETPVVEKPAKEKPAKKEKAEVAKEKPAKK